MSKSERLPFHMVEGNPLPLGVSKSELGVQFSISIPFTKECRLNLYRKGSDCKEMSFLMKVEGTQKMGNVFFCTLCGEQVASELEKKYRYSYEADGKEQMDPYARKVSGRQLWGEMASHSLKGEFIFEPFSWEGDLPLRLPFSETILYQLHVRGFTKHKSSKVSHNGTFLGVTEKLDYLKELGVNCIFLLPCYDFNEVMLKKEVILPQYVKKRITVDEIDDIEQIKLNYWGYTGDSNYFAPKSSYAYDGDNPAREFKNMVKLLHKNDIEVVMDMYFAVGSTAAMILDCLRYWVLEYHVDGFRVNQDVVPEALVRQDPILSESKLLGTSWSRETNDFKHVAEYNEIFMNGMRRYLKSDESQVKNCASHVRQNPKNVGVINFIAHVNGFSLMDLVSYDLKHNALNGENNNDGCDNNYSWNCGCEGKTRRKNILKIRKRQIKNAFLLVLLSQGTPMILAGDEFGNTQDGNNNTYCQDNEISWLNWNHNAMQIEILEFVKGLIKFRKEHPVFHRKEELKGMDYIACGFPDISLHGSKAWYPDYSNYNRLLGIMLFGEYVLVDHQKHDQHFYIACNMHWEPQVFDMPTLPDNLEWKVQIDSAQDEMADKLVQKTKTSKDKKIYKIAPRSIVVFIGVVKGKE